MAGLWLQVLCVQKIESAQPWHRISHIGGVDRIGIPWQRTQAEAIDEIETDLFQYYIAQRGHGLPLVVETGRFGNKYLKTATDAESPDHLLALPDCPPLTHWEQWQILSERQRLTPHA